MDTSTVRTDMDNEKPAPERSLGAEYISRENMELAGRLALEQRRANGEVMTYLEDGWIMREYPGQRIVKLAPAETYRSGDFPIEE